MVSRVRKTEKLGGESVWIAKGIAWIIHYSIIYEQLLMWIIIERS